MENVTHTTTTRNLPSRLFLVLCHFALSSCYNGDNLLSQEAHIKGQITKVSQMAFA